MLGLSPASGDDQPPKDEKKYAPMPWHLVDTWWDIGQDTPFESLAVDVTISDDVPSSVNLYISPIGLGHLSKTSFYGGIQTQADGYTKKDQKLRTIGPGFLFSMWGERSLDAIRPSEGGFFQSSGHEGDFVSVRRPYEWKKGKYTYRLTRMDQEMIDGKPFTWVGAFVYSHEKDENVFVGALRFKGENLVLDRKVANFVEVYGRQQAGSRHPEGDGHVRPARREWHRRQEPHGGSDLPEGRPRLRRRRGEGRFPGRHRGPAGGGPGKSPGHADRRQEIAASTATEGLSDATTPSRR